MNVAISSQYNHCTDILSSHGHVLSSAPSTCYLTVLIAFVKRQVFSYTDLSSFSNSYLGKKISHSQAGSANHSHYHDSTTPPSSLLLGQNRVLHTPDRRHRPVRHAGLCGGGDHGEQDLHSLSLQLPSCSLWSCRRPPCLSLLQRHLGLWRREQRPMGNK